jgi:hypothetical protein
LAKVKEAVNSTLLYVSILLSCVHNTTFIFIFEIYQGAVTFSENDFTFGINNHKTVLSLMNKSMHSKTLLYNVKLLTPVSCGVESQSGAIESGWMSARRPKLLG